MPVLREVARWAETSGPSAVLRDEELAQRLGRDRNDPAYLRTLSTLISEQYLVAQELKTAEGYGAMIRGLTSKGYQALGEWPSAEAMTSVDSKEEMRAAVINRLFDASGGSRNSSVDLHALGQDLSLSKHDAEEVGQYLEDRELITFVSQVGLGGSIALTPKGIDEVERGRRTPTAPTEHLPPYQSVVNFHGPVTGAQVQVGSPGAQQVGSFNLAPAEIIDLAQRIRAALADVPVDDAERAFIEENLQQAETYASNDDPPSKRRVRGALTLVGSVLREIAIAYGHSELDKLVPMLPH